MNLYENWKLQYKQLILTSYWVSSVKCTLVFEKIVKKYPKQKLIVKYKIFAENDL